MTIPIQGSVPTLTEESPTAIVDVWGLLAPVGQFSLRLPPLDRTVVLIKTDDLCVIFRSLSEGGALPTHEADGPITVQVLDGHIEFKTGGRTIPLRKGELLGLRARVPHSLMALKQSSILITGTAGVRST